MFWFFDPLHGITAHNVPNRAGRDGLVSQIAKFVNTPVYAISTFSKDTFPLDTVFPNRRYSRAGDWVRTNLYTRSNYSRDKTGFSQS